MPQNKISNKTTFNSTVNKHNSTNSWDRQRSSKELADFINSKLRLLENVKL